MQLSNPNTNAHPILGIVLLATLFCQLLLGFVHHTRFKKLGRRTVWSHIHLWNGRISITVGIVKGGLGLELANASSTIKATYTIVAAIMWSLWLVVAAMNELRRVRQPKAETVPTVSAGPGGGYVLEMISAAELLVYVLLLDDT